MIWLVSVVEYISGFIKSVKQVDEIITINR